MRKLLSLVVAAAALAVVGVAFSSGGPTSRLASEVRVYGGGLIGPGCFKGTTVCFDAPRRIGVDAHVEGFGAGVAYGSFEYGKPGAYGLAGEVTCVHVDGAKAIVGGILTSATAPFSTWVGGSFIYYVIDHGAADALTPDEASQLWVDPPGTVQDFPASFPRTCPGTPLDVAPAMYQDVIGDIVVQSGQ